MHLLYPNRVKGCDGKFISNQDIQGALNELGYKDTTFSTIF